MAAHHRVLMVGEKGVILYKPQQKGIGREALIAWDANDFDARMAEVLHHAGDDVVVLFNEGDHTYRKEENLPVAEWRSKLETAMKAFPNRAGMEIAGAHETGMGDYLFVGLPDNARYGRLGHLFGDAGVHVAGCGLLPVESSSLVAELAGKVFTRTGERKSRWALLAGQHETGGMRHVCIKDGNLALTRLFDQKDAAASSPAIWANTTMGELRVTVDYLRRFGYTADQGMDVMMICDQSEKKLFAANAIADTELRCLTLSEALRQLGSEVAGQAGDHFADALHAAWAERSGQLRLQLHVPAIEG